MWCTYLSQICHKTERSRPIVNLTDPVFRGIHRGRRKHEGEVVHSDLRYLPDVEGAVDDFGLVLERSQAAGVKSMIVTGGSLQESEAAIALAKKYGALA